MAAAVPVRARPESQLPGLMERFKVSAHYLAYTAPPANFLERWRRAYHRHEVATLPAKARAWMPRLTPYLTETAQADVAALLAVMENCQAELVRDELESESIKTLSDAYIGIDWTAWPRPGF